MGYDRRLESWSGIADSWIGRNGGLARDASLCEPVFCCSSDVPISFWFSRVVRLMRVVG
jgi:hypothetical protein